MAGRTNNASRNVDGVSRKTSSDGFFDDLKKQSRNFTNFWVLVTIILVLIFATLVGIAISTRRATLDVTGNNPEESESKNLLSFAERTGSILSVGPAKMIFSSEEFGTAAGIKESDFPLKSPKFIITKDDLLLVGRINGSFVFWPVKFKVLPEVKDEKFHFVLSPDALENILLSSADKEKIESIFDKNFNQVLADKKLTARDALLSDGYIEINVVKGAK